MRGHTPQKLEKKGTVEKNSRKKLYFVNSSGTTAYHMHAQYTLACHAYIWLKTPVEEVENKSAPSLSTRERIVYSYFPLSRLISTRRLSAVAALRLRALRDQYCNQDSTHNVEFWRKEQWTILFRRSGRKCIAIITWLDNRCQLC